MQLFVYHYRLTDKVMNQQTKDKSMKRYLITILLAGALLAPVTIQAQKHRHHPQVVNPTTVPDSSGIVAYSDTTSTDTAGTSTPVYIDEYDDDDDFFMSPSDMKDLVGGGLGAILAVILILLIVLGPFIFVGFIIYLIFKNRRQRYQLAEKAMESGQQIPQELVRTELQSDEYLWKKGIKNVFLGIGLAILFKCLGADPLTGIGWLVALYGVGQAVISKTSSRKRDRYDDNINPPVE